MNTCVLEDTQTKPMVLMGQIYLIQDEYCGRAVLGSCIGLAIVDRRKKLTALAHIVLPEACEREGSPGKFADTAIPEMLRLLSEQKATRGNLIAKFAGGAEMFEKLGPLKIGQENVHAVTRTLQELNIPIVGSDTGGCKGRRVVCTATGEMTVEVLGQAEIIL